MPALPQPPERLTDGTIEIREMLAWDIPEILIAFEEDPDLHRRIGRAAPPTGAQLGRELEQLLAERVAGRRLTLTIVDPGDPDWRGRVTLKDFDWQARAASMQIFLAPQVRGRRYEQRAMSLVLDWLFAAIEVDRVTVTIDQAQPRVEFRDQHG
ncbi:MAG: GNAT family N-acetyltransferase [Solirubrobacteraceae bacterium]